MLSVINSLPNGPEILRLAAIALPTLVVGYLVGGSILRIGLRLFLAAFQGCQHMSDVFVTRVSNGTLRLASVVLGLLYLWSRWVSYPVLAGFVRVESWVNARVNAVPAGPAIGAPDPAHILGLNGEFTRSEMEEKHRALITNVHPDRGGSDWLAQQVNNARDSIKRVRGWK